MYYVINEHEQRELTHRGVVSSRLAGYWHDLLAKLPNHLKVEALGKSFQLKDHPELIEENSSFSRNLYFYVPDSSPELHHELLKGENAIICMFE